MYSGRNHDRLLREETTLRERAIDVSICAEGPETVVDDAFARRTREIRVDVPVGRSAVMPRERHDRDANAVPTLRHNVRAAHRARVIEPVERGARNARLRLLLPRRYANDGARPPCAAAMRPALGHGVSSGSERDVRLVEQIGEQVDADDVAR